MNPDKMKKEIACAIIDRALYNLLLESVARARLRILLISKYCLS